MAHKARLLMTEFVTHDVKRLVLAKPKGFQWIPGQGTLLSINKPGLKDEAHPFTPTGLTGAEVVEFTIKQYPDRRGLTQKLHNLAPGAELLLDQVFGDIQYKGVGTFIAGGAGITPFVAVLRQLSQEGKLRGNSLIFSNKTWEDIILERELKSYLGDRCTFTLTQEKRPGYEHRPITEALLKEKIRNFGQYFYVCGPPKFIEDINGTLEKLGAKRKKFVFDEP